MAMNGWPTAASRSENPLGLSAALTAQVMRLGNGPAPAAEANTGRLWGRPGSPVVVGLFHDLCKLEAYESAPGGWVHADSKQHLYTGHGEKSVLILAPWMQLTPEEVACIRWHMGAFDNQEQWSHYTAAVRRFPNVLWTHHADMIAAHILQR